MAIYHLSAKIISRSSGRSSVGASAYRAGVKLIDERTQETLDYSRKKVDGSEILAHDNSPAWVHDRNRLWNEVERAEKRKDSQTAREVEISLPKELSFEDRKALTRAFVKEQFVSQGMIADVSFHDQQGDNPHAHILLTTRDITPEGFQQKNREWNRKELLESWREEWSKAANIALEKAGIESRIDHRSLEAQGIDREAQIHLGPHVVQMEARNIKTERGSKLLAIHERNEARELERKITHERNRENPAGEERERDGGRARVNGSIHGEVERRPERDLGGAEEHSQLRAQHDREQQHETERLHPDGSHGSPEHRKAVQELPGGTAQSSQELHLEDVANGNAGELPRWGGSRDRIMALAEAVEANRGRSSSLEQGGEHLQQPGPGKEAATQKADGMARATSKAQDRTAQAIERQLKAFGCRRYEVGIREQSTGRMLNREWTAEQVKENAAWLKRQNAQGNDIYIRPSKDEPHGLVLVDDLKKEALARMKADGYAPALITETSPGNFQAWVKLPGAAQEDTRKEAARELAKAYEGDPMSADARHYGRLSGFTNQKPKHRNIFGQQPYALARDTSGQEAPRGADLIQQAQDRLKDRAKELEASKRLQEMREAGERKYAHSGVVDAYRREAWQLAAKYDKPDWSRIDYAVTKKLALTTRFTADDLTQAIRTASPFIEDRHQGKVEDYAKRTVSAVMQREPEALQGIAKAEHALEIELKLVRGLSQSR